MGVRRADFAGSWYPGGEAECLKAIEGFSRASIPCPSEGGECLGGIVPHAGWYYSGQIAFNVIKCIKNDSLPDTMVIFGMHLHPGSGNYIMKEGAWATPIGNLEIERDLSERLVSEYKFNVETSTVYEPDTTIEIQLPFVKYLFPDVKIIPIGVPPAASSIRIGERVAEIAREIGQKILVLGSTDLTHYGHVYGHAPKGIGRDAVDWVKNENDKRIIEVMLDLDPEGAISESLRNSNACCSGAVAAAIAAVKEMGARRGEKLIYTTSYDIRPNDSFVGYVGIIYK